MHAGLPTGPGDSAGKRFRLTKTPAVKGRWAGMPIDPSAYGLSTCGFALRNLHKSPGRVSWALTGSATGMRAASAPGLRRLVQVSCGWTRAAAPFDLRAFADSRASAATPRPASSRRLARRTPSGRGSRASGCTFFAVCCAFVGERAVSCTFFEVRCRGRRVHGAPPPALPSKTAGQTNDDEMTYGKEDAEYFPDDPKGGRIGPQSRNKPKKTCTKPLSADARPRAAGPGRCPPDRRPFLVSDSV